MRVAGMRLILGEEFADARVINIGAIDALQDGAIAFHKPLRIHTRLEIEPQIEIVSVAVAYDAAFLLQPAIELRFPEGLAAGRPWPAGWRSPE